MQFCNIELTFNSHGYVCIAIIYKYVFHNVLIFYLAYYCTLVKINLLEFLCKKKQKTKHNCINVTSSEGQQTATSVCVLPLVK